MTANRRWNLGAPHNKQFKWKYWISGFFIAPIVMFLGLTEFLTEPVTAFDLIASVLSILIFGAFVNILRHLDNQNEATSIEIDYSQGIAIFRNYPFITDFRGNKVREKEEVPFANIYSTNITQSNGSTFLELTTGKGTINIGGYAEIEEITNCFEEITKLNQETNPDFEAGLATVPRPKTAWYGWLILLTTVAIVIYLGWLYMYAPG